MNDYKIIFSEADQDVIGREAAPRQVPSLQWAGHSPDTDSDLVLHMENNLWRGSSQMWTEVKCAFVLACVWKIIT